MPTGPKFDTEKREEVMATVAKMYRRGSTNYEIMTAVGISSGMVSNYLQMIKDRYRAIQFENHAEYIAEKLEQYREVRKEAWDAYEKSKANMEKLIEEERLQFQKKEKEEQTKNGNGNGYKNGNGKGKKIPPIIDEPRDIMKKVKQIRSTEGRLPSSTYLDIVLRTLDAECKLLGLEPIQINHTTVNVDWSNLYKKMDEVDKIEERIKQEQLLPPQHIIIEQTIGEDKSKDNDKNGKGKKGE